MPVALSLIFISLVIMIYQDIRFRHIHIAMPFLLLCGAIYVGLNIFSGKELAFITAYNCFFLVITLSVLVIYMSIKNKGYSNPFRNYFGLGDLLFYMAAAPLFLLHNYVLFFILSMVFSIVLYYVFKKMLNSKTIPLAGYASLLLMTVIIHDVFSNYPMTLIKQFYEN